jgi:teichuronic acid biosynthesis glycosyltransferase TuaG
MDQALIDILVPGSRGKLPVTVVIPCYRCTRTIRATVNSVILQSAWPEEIILVEDCSGDSGQTLALLETIKSESQGEIKIRILQLQENLGPGEARNAGWELASQDFIAFLDADDTWHPRKLEIQLGWMLAHPYCVLTCHDTVICNNSRMPPLLSTEPEEQLVMWRRMLFRNEIATRTVVLKRRIIQRFPEGVRHGEDYALWLRTLLEGAIAVRLNLPLACSYKSEFGAGGLSANLAEMHRGVLRCYVTLFRERLISRSLFFLAVVFEVLKYWSRISITVARRGMRACQIVFSISSYAHYD